MKVPQRVLSGVEAETLREALAEVTTDRACRELPPALLRLVLVAAHLLLEIDDRVAVLVPRREPPP